MSRHCREAALRVCRSAQLDGVLDVICRAFSRSGAHSAAMRSAPCAGATHQVHGVPGPSGAAPYSGADTARDGAAWWGLPSPHAPAWVGRVPRAARGYSRRSGAAPGLASGQQGFDDGHEARGDAAPAPSATSADGSDAEAVHSVEWITKVKAACEGYLAKHGELPAPDAVAGRRPVGRWLEACVREYKQASWPARRSLYERALGPLLQDALRAQQTMFKKCLNAAAQYVAEHGRMPEPDASVPDPFRPGRRLMLGYWIANRRKDFRDGVLSDEHVAALDERLPLWRPAFESRGAQWQSRMDAFKAFYDTFGRLPRFRDDDWSYDGGPCSVSLARWLACQRQRLRKRRLPRHQIEALDGVTPAWRPVVLQLVPVEQLEYEQPPRRQQEKEAFEETVAAIAAYVQEHGHLPRSSAFHTTDVQAAALAKWLDARRCDHARNKLAAWRVKLLDDKAPGWSQPCTHFQRSWEHKFATLKRFVQQRQRPPRSGETVDGIRLDSWMHSQRLRYRYGILAKERELALRRDAPFVLAPLDRKQMRLLRPAAQEGRALQRD